ncbi:MAG: TetR/AcrR family transcriptional regulator [Ilumatobacteraceae bacterium]
MATSVPIDDASGPGDDGAEGDAVWRDRAIERSTRAARERAAVRVQQFLNAAREIIDEKDSTEFTVQEVVDRSKQSLRSFYQYFDGKHELLLALFEEEMGEAVARVRRVTSVGDPLDRLGRAVMELYDLCSPSEVSEQPLFLEFAQRLLVTHPADVANAYAPLLEYFVAMVEEASEAGLLRPGRPRRQAAIVLQSATTTAGRSAGGRQPITAAEMWEYCLHAIAPDSVVDQRSS